MAIQTITPEDLLDMYVQGGFIGRTPTGEWWCANHADTPHALSQVHHALPIALVLAGQLRPDQYDPYAGLTRYRLVAVHPPSAGAADPV